jgi:GNAT superfamily N-acetyltransferase
MSIIVRRFAAEEWRTYRELRLNALAESPDAFGSTFEREAARSDDEWQYRLGEGTTSGRDLPLLAAVDDTPTGLAWARIDRDQPFVAHLFQVWVVPERRGHGVGRLLVDAAVAWARSVGAREMRLAVTVGESAAAHLYHRIGFIDEGEPQPLRPGSALQSQPMRLALTTASR